MNQAAELKKQLKRARELKNSVGVETPVPPAGTNTTSTTSERVKKKKPKTDATGTTSERVKKKNPKNGRNRVDDVQKDKTPTTF
jgi:hypothetical protein